jgi:hypothetical protein
MGKSSGKTKKHDDVRRSEAETLLGKILSFGFPSESPGIVELRCIFDDFSERGIGASGTIHLPEFKVSVVYKLSTQTHIVSDALIRKTG